MKTLFIIGNGFDRYHNLPTSYSCFREWLKEQQGGIDFIESMEMMLGKINRNGKNILWTNFEEAISLCDIESKYNLFAEQSEELRDDAYRFLTTVDDYISDYLSYPLQVQMPNFFCQWVSEINMKIYQKETVSVIPGKLLYFDREGLFLTFNYTDTLEHLYQINEDRICHIHNRVYLNEKPIIGHNSKKIQIKMPIDLMKGEIDIKQSMANVIDSFRKNHLFNIKNNMAFFDQIDENVNRVVVYGHSLNKIDMPYFRKIKKLINQEIEWYVSYHDNNDYQQIEMARKIIGIDRYHFHPFLLKNDVVTEC